MKRTIGIATFVMVFASGGCAQVMYDSLQNSQTWECQGMQGTADRDACMQRSNMTYDEYQQQLDRRR